MEPAADKKTNMNQNQEYISGMGKESVVPPELQGWNWGAFLLNWVWGLGNSTYIALLMFVPFVNFVMIFVLGVKGNQWAWQNRTWRDIDHFRRTQRDWTVAGVVFYVLVSAIAGVMFVGISKMMKGEAFEQSLAEIESNSEVIGLIGAPMRPGMFVMGNISTKVTASGPSGQASLQYSISGPKGSAEAHVFAIKNMQGWILQEVVVYNEKRGERIQVVVKIE